MRPLRPYRTLAVAALAIVATSAAYAASEIEAPSYRQLDAVEPMTEAGINGTDYSANPPSLAGLSLLATIPAAVTPRRGYFVEAQCTAGLTVVFDDGAGALTPSIVVLAGAAANGAQGGSLTAGGMPHSGRIRIYSTSPTCQMAARAW